MFRVKCAFLLLFNIFFYEARSNPNIYHVALNGNNSISLSWILDYNSDTLTFEIHLPFTKGWFAFGFSNRGELLPADYCVLWTSLSGKYYLQDATATEEGVLKTDKQQDCHRFKFLHREIFKFSFRRKFDTCDTDDYIIEEGTTHLVWSRGFHPLYKLNGVNISNTEKDSGMVRVQLLKNENVPKSDLPSHVTTFDVLTDNVKVPAEETTYWCHVYKLPEQFNLKHHIYQYEANIKKSSEGIVHHMEVFHCVGGDDVPLYKGDCFAKDRPQATQICKKVLAAWAMGATAFRYPEESSLAMGGPSFGQYLMLEVHYNNPERLENIIDSSGIRFFVSKKLKRFDAGVIELGLEYTDKMAIPPGQERFSLSGYCISSCTSMGLPENGITIFGSQLHTHLTGVAVHTKHFNAFGEELPELNRDNHFSTHFQEIRLLKRPTKVLPGDILITKCDYNTISRQNITLGGFSISDEMCVNYIHYFPHTDLEVCKSAISYQALQTYFRYMNEWENQATLPGKAISNNYQAIDWNKIRVQLLDEVYRESPLSMQCNMSSGDRFPGYWENSKIPTITTTLPPPARQCNSYS